MPSFDRFESFIRSVREHLRLGEAHVLGMLPADSPPDIGYACTQCEGEFFRVSVAQVTILRRRAVSGSPLDRLMGYFVTSQGRRELPQVLADGYFDALPMLTSGDFWSNINMNGDQYDVLALARAAEAGIRDVARPRPIPSSVAIPAPEEAQEVTLRSYRRRPEVIQAFEVTESGWYNVPGVGVSVLTRGLYVFTESGLETRDRERFEQQFEPVIDPAAQQQAAEDADIAIVPGRFERDDVV